MVCKRVTIKNPTGLHLRPAGQLCSEAVKYDSEITIRHKNVSSNAKSLLSVLGSCIKFGDEVEFICEGQDEREALAAMVVAIDNGLGE